MRTSSIAFWAIWGIVLYCTGLQAAVIIETESTSDLGTSLTFGQFNTSLGTLTQIIVDTTSTLRSDGSFSNTGHTTATVQTILDGTYTLELPNTTITSPDEHIDTGVLHVPSHQTITWGPLSASASTHNVFTHGSDLIFYEGSGTFDVNADEIVNNSGFRTGTGSIMICNSACLDVTITYCYTPNVAAPEPSAIWGGAVALALACFAIVAKRRKAGGSLSCFDIWA